MIYTNDHEPAHVHVYGDGEARIDIVNVEVISNRRMSKRDLSVAPAIVRNSGPRCYKAREAFMGETVLEDRAYREVTERGERARAQAMLPVAVGFDETSGRIVIDFDNGTTFLVPAERLEGLQGASAVQLGEVELLGETGLHWESLNVDFTIEGLMRGLFGTARFMEAQRRGGRSCSEAKVAASRANGAKGGRPRSGEHNGR